MRVRVKLIEPAPVESATESIAERDAVDLGPGAERIHALLDRAARLTVAQRARLADEVAWRSWAIALPPGGALAAARATAAVCARRAGRRDALSALTPMVRQALGSSAAADRRCRQAVLDAATAILVADIVPDGTAQLLSAAWHTALG